MTVPVDEPDVFDLEEKILAVVNMAGIAVGLLTAEQEQFRKFFPAATRTLEQQHLAFAIHDLEDRAGDLQALYRQVIEAQRQKAA